MKGEEITVEKIISVIVPIYNSEKYLNKCIDSILNQSYKNFELILIDDGSKDNSLSICNKYAALDSRVKVHHKENEGIAKTRNYGLQVACGEYITFVDSDDYVDNNFLKLLFEAIEENHCELSICSFARFMDSKIIHNNTEESRVVDKSDLELLFFTDSNIGKANWNKLYKARLLGNMQFPDICLGEDYVFNFEYLKKVKKVAIINNELYYYRITPASLSNLIDYNRKKMMDQIISRSSVIESIQNKKALTMAKKEYLKAVKNAMILLLKSKDCGGTSIRDYTYYKCLVKDDFSVIDILRLGAKGIIQLVLCLYFPFIYSIRKN